MLLGVDTLDATKGLVHKFLALEEMFEMEPGLADRVNFVQVWRTNGILNPGERGSGGCGREGLKESKACSFVGNFTLGFIAACGRPCVFWQAAERRS